MQKSKMAVWGGPGEGFLSAGAASTVRLAGGEGLEGKELWAETPRKHGESLEPPSFSLDQRVLGPKSPFWISWTSTIYLSI